MDEEEEEGGMGCCGANGWVKDVEGGRSSPQPSVWSVDGSRATELWEDGPDGLPATRHVSKNAAGGPARLPRSRITGRNVTDCFDEMLRIPDLFCPEGRCLCGALLLSVCPSLFTLPPLSLSPVRLSFPPSVPQAGL